MTIKRSMFKSLLKKGNQGKACQINNSYFFGILITIFTFKGWYPLTKESVYLYEFIFLKYVLLRAEDK